MSYDSTILGESNLTAYYKLNETSGTTATDSSSNAYNGTLNGTITLNQAAIAAGLDPCFLFDGSTGYISLPTGVNVTEPISVEMWIKDNSIAANGIWYDANALSGFEFGWHQSASNKIFVAGAGGSYDTTNALTSGAVYYVCLTIDTSNNYAVYAGKVGTDSAPSQWGTANPGGAPTYSGSANIGRETDASLYFKGYISSVAVYHAVLTGTQMNNHYTLGTTAPGGGAPKLNISDGYGGVFS